MRLIVDLPYAEGVHQIAQSLSEGILRNIPGAEVQIVETDAQQPDAARPRGLAPAGAAPPPLTRQPRTRPTPGPPGQMARRQPQQLTGPIGRPMPG